MARSFEASRALICDSTTPPPLSTTTAAAAGGDILPPSPPPTTGSSVTRTGTSVLGLVVAPVAHIPRKKTLPTTASGDPVFRPGDTVSLRSSPSGTTFHIVKRLNETTYVVKNTNAHSEEIHVLAYDLLVVAMMV